MKVVLVTGGSRGIGAATIKHFARNGYTVILNYNTSMDSALLLQKSLREEGCDVHSYCADVSDSTQVEQMFLWVKKFFKRIDVLVNNAGVALSKLCQDISESEYDKVMDINAKGTFLCCRQAVPLFLSSGGGAIVNVSSIWGVCGASCESVYSMSKHAVIGLTRSLADELSFAGVTVNCVCPPIVSTEMCAHLSQEDIAEFCKQYSVQPYSAEMVAQDIFSLATGSETGIILQEE